MRDDRIRQILRVEDGGDLPDGESLIGSIDEAASVEHDGVCRRPDDGVEGYVMSAEPIRIDEHLQLRIALAPDGDVGDARDRHQPRADRPDRQFGNLLLRQLLRRHADLHHPAERREGLQDHRRAGHDGQPGCFDGQSLLDELPGPIEVLSVLQQQPDR